MEALDAGGAELKIHFLDKMLTESGYAAGMIHHVLEEYLLSMTTTEMVVKIMAGVRKNELDFVPQDLVSKAEEQDYPFFLDPMPNLFHAGSCCINW